ncbi:hypothetical protein ONS95_004887 [Cadophora gregata]|uniref:uncharacterized protein n=1 Tax=Cadophora gregata TaxID=51156 RepID=UPI0026DADB6D|nr:uncharacterized protein ONS95_004887 [Cadophora gregata]KAK0104601.1 hypothetical protein ONS95_004887 [Cadophora gregata]KAK0115312.1 hypothetical protein ONS96_013771 [Cadophora gregata f. sp. sojae]
MATMEAWPTRPNRGWLNNRPKGLKTTADFFREAQARDPYIPPAWMLPPKFEQPKQETVRYEQSAGYNDNLRHRESIRYGEVLRHEESIHQEETILPEDIPVQEKRVPKEDSAPNEESGWDVDEDFTHPSEISMSTSPRIRIFTRAVPKRKMNFVELAEYFGKTDNSRLMAANRCWPEEGEEEDEDEAEEAEEEDDEDRNTLRKLSRISMSPKVESILDIAAITPERAPKIPKISLSPKVERRLDLAETATKKFPQFSRPPKKESTLDLANTGPEKVPKISVPPKVERTLNLADTAPERLELKAERDSTLDAFESALSTQEHNPTCCEKYYAQMTKLDHVKHGIRDVKEGLGRLIETPNVPKTIHDIAFEENRTQGRFAAFALNRWIGVVCAILFTLFLLEWLLWGIYGRRTASKKDNWHPHDPFFGHCLTTKLNEWTFNIFSYSWYAFRDLVDGYLDPYGTRFRPVHPRTARMGANDWWQGRSGPVGLVARMDPGIMSDRIQY